jgi:anthranilate phosphoribosyltransferase
MNAALILYAAGKGATWVSCVPLARRALEDGSAARKLEELTQEPVGIGVTGRIH